MWYVIQVQACHETEMVNKCREIIKDGEEVFTMMTERLERRNGKWQPIRHITFQKYVFLDTAAEPDDLRIRLRQIRGMTKLQGTEDYIIPIQKDEEDFLKRIGGRDHVIGKLEVYCDGDKVKIINGPFVDMEGLVKWKDKRQKLIGVAVKLMGQETIIKLGAEYIRPA